MYDQLDGFTSWMNPNIKDGFMASTHSRTWGSICMKFEFFMQASNKSFTFDN
jgi:hypothetical protein